MNTLDSVVDALARDPARKFVVVEQVHKWNPMMCSVSASLAIYPSASSYADPDQRTRLIDYTEF